MILILTNCICGVAYHISCNMLYPRWTIYGINISDLIWSSIHFPPPQSPGHCGWQISKWLASLVIKHKHFLLLCHSQPHGRVNNPGSTFSHDCITMHCIAYVSQYAVFERHLSFRYGRFTWNISKHQTNDRYGPIYTNATRSRLQVFVIHCMKMWIMAKLIDKTM